MDWLLIVLVSAFAVVTTVICVSYVRSQKAGLQKRLVVYDRDGYDKLL